MSALIWLSNVVSPLCTQSDKVHKSMSDRNCRGFTSNKCTMNVQAGSTTCGWCEVHVQHLSRKIHTSKNGFNWVPPSLFQTNVILVFPHVLNKHTFFATSQGFLGRFQRTWSVPTQQCNTQSNHQVINIMQDNENMLRRQAGGRTWSSDSSSWSIFSK